MPYKDPEARRVNARRYWAENRAELNAYYRQYGVGRREQRKAYGREYHQTDTGYAVSRASLSRSAAKRRGAVLDPELTNAILTRVLLDHENCDLCSNPVPLHDRMIDHRVAICFGGEHATSNIQILCKPCEKQKSGAEKSLAAKLRNGAIQTDFVLAA